MSKIWLSVKHDRHHDDLYIAFEAYGDAWNCCVDWASRYPPPYHFESKENGYLWCSDDYNMHVEQIDFTPAQ